ncbi:MAG: hypothetical protein LQ338_004467 [Usnochroma carphineum]|nr:MAG: hypothetical protein LQ338_004467 [Usnochroma carphineum]
MTPDRTDALVEEWQRLYGVTLPSLALSKSPVQDPWPVHVDHCFGRIILDSVVGKDSPWMEKLRSPAIKNMTPDQLKKCIALGNAIAEGKESLVELDAKSLQLRGKKQKKQAAANSKRKREAAPHDGTSEDRNGAAPKKRQIDIKSALSPSSSKEPQDLLPLTPRPSTSTPKESSPTNSNTLPTDLHNLITTSTLTPFRQRVLLALCQVPPGRFTTYATMATHLHSSARAVGNALKNNPFAPRVPCHRVVAADRGLGGFGGEWGIRGKHAGEKVRLLRGEGVVVDQGRGRVEGDIWRGFV